MEGTQLGPQALVGFVIDVDLLVDERHPVAVGLLQLGGDVDDRSADA
jgi:hypothetical protein